MATFDWSCWISNYYYIQIVHQIIQWPWNRSIFYFGFLKREKSGTFIFCCYVWLIYFLFSKGLLDLSCGVFLVFIFWSISKRICFFFSNKPSISNRIYCLVFILLFNEVSLYLVLIEFLMCPRGSWFVIFLSVYFRYSPVFYSFSSYE